jgi:aspartate aminotransferase
VNEKTKAVLINSPNNPTGRVYDETSIRALASLLEDKGNKIGRAIYLVSDEPYDKIVYDGVKVPSLLKAYRNSLVANSYSKTLSIPGERIGFIAVNPRPTASICYGRSGHVQPHARFVNAPAFIQRVLPKVLDVEVNVAEYAQAGSSLRRPRRLRLRVHETRGGLLTCSRSRDRGRRGIRPGPAEKNILTVPGSGFGAPGYFRIAYCVEDRTIVDSLKGFGEVIRQFRA